MPTDTKNMVIGIILIVVGALLLLGKISFLGILGMATATLGIIIIVVGVLMILNVIPGGTLIALVLIVLGFLLALHFFDPKIPNDLKPIFAILDLVVGIVLVVIGVLKVMGKR